MCIRDSQDGASVSLEGLRGQRVVLYFYPAAMTPGCTTEALSLIHISEPTRPY